MQIILLNGTIGVGKTYLSNIFTNYGYSKEAYATTLKLLTYDLMKYLYKHIEPKMIFGDYVSKNTPLEINNAYSSLNASFIFDDWLSNQDIYPVTDPKLLIKCKKKLFKYINKNGITPREIMQYLGTDILRNLVHKDFNVLSLIKRIKNTSCNYIIDDYRFLNEYTILKQMGYDVYAVKISKEIINTNHLHSSENQELYFDTIIHLEEDELVSDKHYFQIIENLTKIV